MQRQHRRELGGELERQRAAAWQSVAGVHRQMQQRVADVDGIGLHHHRACRQRRGELDIGTEDAAQQAHRVHHDIGEIDEAGLRGVRPREGEHLLRDDGGPLGGATDLQQIFVGLLALVGGGQQQVGVAEDRRELIVEIVRDAAGQAAQCGELPQRAHFGFERFDP